MLDRLLRRRPRVPLWHQEGAAEEIISNTLRYRRREDCTGDALKLYAERRPDEQFASADEFVNFLGWIVDRAEGRPVGSPPADALRALGLPA